MAKQTILSIFVAVGALASLGACRGWDSDQPPVHLNPNMDTQQKGKAFTKSDFFRDGQYMRQPVPGTVARGWLKDDDTFELGVDAAGQPLNKLPDQVKIADATNFTTARGKKQFDIYCTPCHGKAADGKGTVSLPGRLPVPAPSFYDARLKEMPVGKFYAAMLNGVNNGNMPSYAAQISTADRWEIALHIRSLQHAQDSSIQIEAKPPEPPPDLTVASEKGGAYLYKNKGCNACHSLDGTRVVGPSFKALWGKTEKTSAGDVVVDSAYFKESVQNPSAKIVDGFPPAMPPQTLTDVEIQSLELFLQAQK